MWTREIERIRCSTYDCERLVMWLDFDTSSLAIVMGLEELIGFIERVKTFGNLGRIKLAADVESHISKFGNIMPIRELGEEFLGDFERLVGNEPRIMWAEKRGIVWDYQYIVL